MNCELHPALLNSRYESTAVDHPHPVDLVVPVTSPGERPSVPGSQPHDRGTPRGRLLLWQEPPGPVPGPSNRRDPEMNRIRTPQAAAARADDLRDSYVVSGG